MDQNEITSRDRALFEAGIKLGALYHQFMGMPVSIETVDRLESAIEKSVSLQPWVDLVKVRIDREKLRANENQFKYCELSGEMLDVEVVVTYDHVEVHARIRYDEEMRYPLMRIEKVSTV